MSVKPATSYEQICRTIVKSLKDSSGLAKNLIVNADSVQGVNPMNKNACKVAEAITQENSFIIFNIEENLQSEIYAASRIDNTHMETLTEYVCSLKIYGDNAHNLALKIFSTLKTSSIFSDLETSGVFIKDFSRISSTKEFINNALWVRCDLSFNFESVQHIEVAAQKYATSIKSQTINII